MSASAGDPRGAGVDTHESQDSQGAGGERKRVLFSEARENAVQRFDAIVDEVSISLSNRPGPAGDAYRQRFQAAQEDFNRFYADDGHEDIPVDMRKQRRIDEMEGAIAAIRQIRDEAASESVSAPEDADVHTSKEKEEVGTDEEQDFFDAKEDLLDAGEESPDAEEEFFDAEDA